MMFVSFWLRKVLEVETKNWNCSKWYEYMLEKAWESKTVTQVINI